MAKKHNLHMTFPTTRLIHRLKILLLKKQFGMILFETNGLIHIELMKERKSLWWENVSPLHPTIDVALCDDGDLLMVDVPNEQRAEYDRKKVTSTKNKMCSDVCRCKIYDVP